ncbi:MAG: metallophosphoesterase [Candidatus Dormibacteria bacterium]
MIRVAAVADIHCGLESGGEFLAHAEALQADADVLLFAGDMTRHGDPAEAAVLARDLQELALPRVAVLGNHDYHSDKQVEIRAILEAAGVQVLEGETTVLQVAGHDLGIAGMKGFGGGFTGASGSAFGEPEMKAYYHHTEALAAQFEESLHGLRGDVRVALLHYSPVRDTCEGERPEIFPFLGSYLFADAIDRVPVDLVLHGHAHAGSEEGATAGGVPVRNVAQMVIRKPYAVFELAGRDAVAPATA